jgi:hypothetical protein
MSKPHDHAPSSALRSRHPAPQTAHPITRKVETIAPPPNPERIMLLAGTEEGNDKVEIVADSSEEDEANKGVETAYILLVRCHARVKWDLQAYMGSDCSFLLFSITSVRFNLST